MGTQRKRNELTTLEPQSVTSVSAEASLCRALDLLLNNMVEVYLDAEKIHWHLKLSQPERGPCGMAKKIFGKMLSSITLLARLECQFGEETLTRCNQLIEIAERRIANL